ncbi:hypothetical protein RND71_014524 [Anisodus tanguticus]|uniref:Uncharacterized protein n=1 Tax=Anisodus tanguticus TaxID=243964 RepID=A0AAE1S9A1_9SOLA|nr:hypothetical protein RND71_014524 [Anisodus tanguticus]
METSSSQVTKRGSTQNLSKKRQASKSGIGKDPTIPVPRRVGHLPEPYFVGAGYAEGWYDDFDLSEGWKKVFDQPGPDNIDMVMELYVNFDQQRVHDLIDNMVDISKFMAPRQSEKYNLTPIEERSAQSTLFTQMHKMAFLGKDANLPDDEDACSVDPSDTC